MKPAATEFGAAAAESAARSVRHQLDLDGPLDCAIVLGSGLGGLVRRISGARRIAFGSVPGFPAATVVGHVGALVTGTLAGRTVVALAGRFHMYEGHAAALAGFPVRVLHALGARTLFVSNAAGGIRRTFRAGDLMRIDDHINLMWRAPLVGPLESGDERFPDMSRPYDAALGRALMGVAAAAGITMQEGVYAGLLGPSYETPSEVRMLERIGADAVGMSTVPEVIVARALGMRVAGVSCITNLASGISPTVLDHREVLDTTTRVAEQFESLVEAFVGTL